MWSVQGNNTESGVAASLRLMQLVSPSLPVGGFAYSRGMEQAVEAGWIKNEHDTADWIFGLLSQVVASTDIPLFKRMYLAWEQEDTEKVWYWNNYLYAMRESSEFQAEESNMGKALARLLASLEIKEAQEWKLKNDATFASLFALASVQWQIPLFESSCGYIWSWLDNQVAAAIKLVPLGQTAGQRLLSEGIPLIDSAVQKGVAIEDDEIGFAAPGLAMASALHETQHTRLFRS